MAQPLVAQQQAMWVLIREIQEILVGGANYALYPAWVKQYLWRQHLHRDERASLFSFLW